MIDVSVPKAVECNFAERTFILAVKARKRSAGVPALYPKAVRRLDRYYMGKAKLHDLSVQITKLHF